MHALSLAVSTPTWFDGSDYLLSRVLLQRGLGALYLIAFIATVNQFRPLLGEHGLQPVPLFVRTVPFHRSPSLFYWRYSDRLLLLAAWAGALLSAGIVVGLVERAPLLLSIAAWLIVWVLYLSIVNVGQTFYAFGWETLLCEAGFLAAFLGSSEMAPPIIVLWLFRWLVFRVEFGAGLIKMRGDPCWRNLTCLLYHHETQPLPNPLSWYFHHLPTPLHRVEVAANHVVQLVIPFGLFAPQPISGIAAGLIIVTQCWLLLSGNFSWLNWITIVIATAALPDSVLHHVMPSASVPGSTPVWFFVLVAGVAAVLVVLSYRPARNLLSHRQMMNTSFDPLRLVNTYGAFGHITKVRNELVIEGTADEELSATTVWSEYEFKAKPGDPGRRPRQIAPYHLRLDWLMWFAAMGPPHRYPWIRPLVVRLLENDVPTTRLLGHNPFDDGDPPTHVRVLLYRYRFTDRGERREEHRWWHRDLIGTYLSPMRLHPDGSAGTSTATGRHRSW